MKWPFGAFFSSQSVSSTFNQIERMIEELQSGSKLRRFIIKDDGLYAALCFRKFSIAYEDLRIKAASGDVFERVVAVYEVRDSNCHQVTVLYANAEGDSYFLGKMGLTKQLEAGSYEWHVANQFLQCIWKELDKVR